MRLSRYERETIINFNEANHVAYIYTCSKSWIRHLERLGLKPTETHSYAREYECPKEWIRKPYKPRKYTKEQKQRLAQRLPKISILSEEIACAAAKSGGKNGR
jgi:hypothetical protein